MKRNIIFRIAFCIMGIACMIAGIRLIIAGPVTYIEQHEQVDWPEIRAEIVDISSRVESTGTRKHHSSTTYYDLIIEYEVNGNIYTNESRKRILSSDGVTVIANDGKILSHGAIVNLGEVVAKGQVGTGESAAKLLSQNGISIKISQCTLSRKQFSHSIYSFASCYCFCCLRYSRTIKNTLDRKSVFEACW